MRWADCDRYGMYKGSAGAGPGLALMGAATLIGASVVDAQGENLGAIKEIMIDMRTGHIAYAVLAVGGFPCMGEKLFAIPWQALQPDTVSQHFTLSVERDRLHNAAGFDPTAWPHMGDIGWARQIDATTAPTPACPGASGLQPATWWVASALEAALGRKWVRRPVRNSPEDQAKDVRM